MRSRDAKSGRTPRVRSHGNDDEKDPSGRTKAAEKDTAGRNKGADKKNRSSGPNTNMLSDRSDPRSDPASEPSSPGPTTPRMAPRVRPVSSSVYACVSSCAYLSQLNADKW